MEVPSASNIQPGVLRTGARGANFWPSGRCVFTYLKQGRACHPGRGKCVSTIRTLDGGVAYEPPHRAGNAQGAPVPPQSLFRLVGLFCGQILSCRYLKCRGLALQPQLPDLPGRAEAKWLSHFGEHCHMANKKPRFSPFDLAFQYNHMMSVGRRKECSFYRSCDENCASTNQYHCGRF